MGFLSLLRPISTHMKKPFVALFPALFSSSPPIRPLDHAHLNLNQECLNLLATCTSMTQLKQIHSRMIRTGQDQRSFTLSKLIEFCAFSNEIDYACFAFNLIDNPNIYLWNVMIRLHEQIAIRDEPIWLYKQMKLENTRPDDFTFSLILKSCARLADAGQGEIIHGDVLKSGFQSETFVKTGLIHFYVVCDCLEDALRLFAEIHNRDLVLWSTMIRGYAKARRPDDALNLFRKMQIANVRPDKVTLVSILSSCAQLGALDFGRWVHAYIEKHNFLPNIYIETALIDMYLKSGCLGSGHEVFNKMAQKDLSSWNAMIIGLALQGHAKDAIEVFHDMQRNNIKPDEISFVGVLSACSHAGLINEAGDYFYSMTNHYGIKPEVGHYGCMVDLLARGGLLKEAQEFIKAMPIEPDAGIWGSLLSASRIHGDRELAETAMKRLIDLEPENSGNYVLLSNMYASSGRWSEVAEMRKVMKDRGIQKRRGCSWIEVNGFIHEFVVEDESHPFSKNIYWMLNDITKELWSHGCVLDEG
ncbi:hypothetical protein AMTRI_Chr08g202900 [Amborella trichopoda]